MRNGLAIDPLHMECIMQQVAVLDRGRWTNLQSEDKDVKQVTRWEHADIGEPAAVRQEIARPGLTQAAAD